MENYKYNVGDEVKFNGNGRECCQHSKNHVKSMKYMSNYTIEDKCFDNGFNWYKCKSLGNWVTEEGIDLVISVKKEQILTIEQLIEGEVYKYIYNKYYGIGICKQSQTNKTKNIIYSDGNYFRENTCNVNKYEKATIEETNWLNICIQENKFIEFNEINNYMNKETKFEVGDWVFIKDDQKNSLGEGVKFDKVINNCLQIEKLNGDFVIQLSGINCSLNSVRFRKALLHEIPNNSSVNTFNFEENKYYSCIDTYLNSNTLWHFQFKSLNTTENKLHYFWSKNYKNVIRTNDYLSYDRFKDFKLVTEQEAKGLPKEEDLLSLAKLKYPIGTKFITAIDGKNTYEVKGDVPRWHEKDISIALSDTIGLVYYKGKWAEIVKQEDNSIPEYNEKIEVGDLVEIIRDGDYNCSDKKVGDKFTIEEIYIVSGMTFYRPNYGKTTGVLSSYTKLIKKKHSNTTVNKQLDISSAKVGNEFNIQKKTEPKELTFVPKIKKSSDFNIKSSKRSKQLTF